MTNEESEASYTGGCLCGAVRYEIQGAIRGVVNCYCTKCRQLHGSMGAHTKTRKDRLVFVAKEGLAWFKSSDMAQRGFCARCGSSLFFEPFAGDYISILAGSLDMPADVKTTGHIYVGEKANFMEISDALPQYAKGHGGELDVGF